MWTDRELRFSELAEAVGPALRRYVVRRLPEQVDDVLSDTFLVLWRRLDDVPSHDPLPWCYGVARGCLANAKRSARRQERLTDKLAGQPIHPPPESDPDLHEALARLSHQEQELIRLWAWEQLQPNEIATVLGITANAVSIRLHRARRKLADLLTDVRKTGAPSGQEQGEERRPR